MLFRNSSKRIVKFRQDFGYGRQNYEVYPDSIIDIPEKYIYVIPSEIPQLVKVEEEVVVIWSCEDDPLDEFWSLDDVEPVETAKPVDKKPATKRKYKPRKKTVKTAKPVKKTTKKPAPKK